jgi:hypothetical protein
MSNNNKLQKFIEGPLTQSLAIESMIKHWRS